MCEHTDIDRNNIQASLKQLSFSISCNYEYSQNQYNFGHLIQYFSEYDPQNVYCCYKISLETESINFYRNLKINFMFLKSNRKKEEFPFCIFCFNFISTYDAYPVFQNIGL